MVGTSTATIHAPEVNLVPTTITVTIPVTITWPAISSLEIVPDSGRLYVGVALAHHLRAVSRDNYIRTDIVATWRSSNPTIATVDRDR